MIGTTGVWSEEEQFAHIFSYNIAHWIHTNINGEFYDLGAGKGHYTQYLTDAHRLCDAYDGFPQGFVKELDLTILTDLPAERNVICLEVWEHIPAEHETIFAANLSRNCKGKLILSVAIEGQQGLGHVNCKSNIYVIDKLQNLGLKLNTKQTLEIRSVAEDYVSYFRNTLLIFDK